MGEYCVNGISFGPTGVVAATRTPTPVRTPAISALGLLACAAVECYCRGGPESSQSLDPVATLDPGQPIL
jgi:hypothetical protein